MTLQKIEFEYDIPDGYRFVRYGTPKTGEFYLNKNDALPANHNFNNEWPIVEKIPGQESKKHRWHDLMIEFANDKTLRFEYKPPYETEWNDAPDNPSFFEDVEYRKKQTKNKACFRLYLNRAGKVKTWEKDHTPDLFVKWLGGWREVEI